VTSLLELGPLRKDDGAASFVSENLLRISSASDLGKLLYDFR